MELFEKVSDWVFERDVAIPAMSHVGSLAELRVARESEQEGPQPFCFITGRHCKKYRTSIENLWKVADEHGVGRLFIHAIECSDSRDKATVAVYDSERADRGVVVFIDAEKDLRSVLSDRVLLTV